MAVCFCVVGEAEAESPTPPDALATRGVQPWPPACRFDPPPPPQMLYRLTPESREIVKGCSDGMCGVALESGGPTPTALDRAFAELNV